MPVPVFRPSIVIPAKAGIHFALPIDRKAKVNMDPGFRRDDDRTGSRRNGRAVGKDCAQPATRGWLSTSQYSPICLTAATNCSKSTGLRM